MSPEGLVAASLRGLSPERRSMLAVRLAEVVEPLAELARLTPEPMSALTDRIKTATPADAANVARLLRAIPAMQEDEEPDGPAWFALGAVVAWIYAAESLSDSTGERLVNTFVRVEDVLDYAQDRLGVGGLCDRLYSAVAQALHGDDSALLAM